MSYPFIDTRIPGPYDRMYQQMVSSLEKAGQLGEHPITIAGQAA